MTKIEIDFSQPRGTVTKIITDNGEIWELKGKCNRCGQCCEKTKMPLPELRKKNGSCKKYSREIENGQNQGKCNIIWTRPAFCLIYPRDPYEKLHNECGYVWERIK